MIGTQEEDINNLGKMFVNMSICQYFWKWMSTI